MVFFFTSDVTGTPYTIYMGVDKHENEDLIKYGWPEDVWFHVDKVSSAHVYLRLKPNETLDDIPEEVLIDCAQLVKANSIQGNKMNNIQMVYTLWSNLKKTGDMAVGQVGFHNHKEVRYIKVEKRINEIVNRLNKTKVEKFPDLMQEKEDRDRLERNEAKKIVKENREKEKEEIRKRKEEQELRSYTSLYSDATMESNRDAGNDSDDFIIMLCISRRSLTSWPLSTNLESSVCFLQRKKLSPKNNPNFMKCGRPTKLIRAFSAKTFTSRNFTTEAKPTEQLSCNENLQTVCINNAVYKTDDWSNVTPKILSLVGRNLHLQQDHPLSLIREIIVNHFYKNYVRSRERPIFAVFDNLSPVVSTYQNFDSMLIPEDHVSRKKSDNYYINSNTLLRAHTSAHEMELIKSGLDAFLIVGDVYRRDSIDTTHYPAFHQVEGARLFSSRDLFKGAEGDTSDLALFEKGDEMPDKQACHTLEASKLVELALKQTLEGLMQELFGKGIESRWVDAYFPFTHPSFELEIKYEGEWMEMLGCGVLRQEILNNAGAHDKIGWAFGLGLERLAMKLFNIPDIRYFWCDEEAFLSQFRNRKNTKNIKFKPFVSKNPALSHDIAFWIPEGYSSTDFYDIVRSVGGNLVESVVQIDDFTHPKTGRQSHCYRLYYRHISRPLSHAEVSKLQQVIKDESVSTLKVEGRW